VLVCFAGTALVLVLVTKAALRVPELDVLVSEVVVVVTSGPECSPVFAGHPASLDVIVVVSAEAVLKPVVVVVVVVVGRGPKTGFVGATAGHVPTLATLIVASGM
jgi:hypothetical protein